MQLFLLKSYFLIGYGQTILIQIQQQMNFRLENPSFSSSDEENEDLLVPSNEMISQYNREYSMIVGQVEDFLNEVKQSVQRFVAYHNFGVNLNLPTLLHNIVGIQTFFKDKLTQTTKPNLNSNDPKNKSKNKYEASFNRLMLRMGDILKDFIECQLQFKKQYFGLKLQKEEQRTNFHPRVNAQSFSVSSLTNSSKSSKFKMQHYLESEQKQQKRQAQLRATLNQRLKPKATAIQIQCKSEYSTTQNLYRLNEKFERMLEDMKIIRNREQKLIQLFNLNRGKKSHIFQTQVPFPSTDVSMVTNQNEELDSYLEEYKPSRREDDLVTEQGCHPKSRGFVKRASTMMLGQFIE